MRIDHVLWRTDDLDATAARFEREFGLVADGGGRHVGQGTHNRIIPVGGGYIELIGVADLTEAAASPFGAAIAAAPDGWMGWAVAVEDAPAQAARIGVELSIIERDGLRASLAGVAQSLETPLLPFFIERDEGIADPGATGDGGGITHLELSGDASVLNGWLGGASLPLDVVPGEPALLAVHLGSGLVIR